MQSQRLKTFFTALFMLELAVFIVVASWLGFWRSVVLVALSSALGIALLQRCGVNLSQQLQQRRGGSAPGLKPMQPAYLLAAILWIIPGFLTTILGALLLVPGLRKVLLALPWLAAIRRASYAQAKARAAGAGFSAGAHGHAAGAATGAANDSQQAKSRTRVEDEHVIEGEFEHEDGAKPKQDEDGAKPEGKR